MHDYGTAPETFAAIAAKNWNHGALNPLAHRQPDHAVTVEEVMASRMIAEPLTAMMCCPADDGAAAVIVAGEDFVRRRFPDRRLVRCLSSAAQSEAYSPGHAFLGPVVGPPTMTRTRAGGLRRSRCGPRRHLARAVPRRLRQRGARVLRAARLLRAGPGRQARGGRRDRAGWEDPVQHRRRPDRPRHPGGPTGVAMVHELALQLRREAGARQVEGARFGLAHCVGGGSVCTVNIFEGVD